VGFICRKIAMARDETIRLEGKGVRVTGVGEPTDEMDEIAGDPEPATRALIDSVTEATWNEALHRLGEAPSNPLPLWMMLATRILRAVADGERDSPRLQRHALDGLSDRDWFGD
jgi:hypothetical protein